MKDIAKCQRGEGRRERENRKRKYRKRENRERIERERTERDDRKRGQRENRKGHCVEGATHPSPDGERGSALISIKLLDPRYTDCLHL